MESRRIRTADAIRMKRGEGWLQYCPLSYDQVRCIHAPFVECYAIQEFSIASDLDPKQITRKKVCIILSFASSKSPFWLQLGLRETPHTSHPETEAECCLRRNQRRAARAAWVRCKPSTPQRDPRTDELARSSRRRAQTLWNDFLQFLKTTWDAALIQRLRCPSNHPLNLCSDPNGQELKRLEEMKVVIPVTYSRWAAPIVVVKKADGSIRLCADFSIGLNAALEDHQYPLPTPDDLYTILNGGTCFAKLDLTEAYLQVEVAATSRELLTINTHRGLFQFTRLPFGVKTAPAIFQLIMDTMLTNVEGTAAYLDDIIIVGQSNQELTERISRVLTCIPRLEKCHFYLPSIKYLGFILDLQGRRSDPANVAAIQHMPPPSDISSLCAFLGLVSYYGSFLLSLHQIKAPLNKLLTKDTKWFWPIDCQKSFDKIKSLIKSDLLLTYSDPNKKIVVAADASNHGVGAVILHAFTDGTEKAIMHTARYLIPAEHNYSQIEKEALALIFAVKKIPQDAIRASLYTHFITISQPGYDFSIQYRRTTEFGQADALSQSVSDDDTVIAATSVDDDFQRTLTDCIRTIPVTRMDIKQETQQDSMIQKVCGFLQHPWPPNLTGDLQQFKRRSGSLSVIDGCLMFTDRVVVPTKLRQTVLK